MSNDKKTPFERAVTQIASKQPELQPKPFKPEMRSDRMWYELQAASARIAELEAALEGVLSDPSHHTRQIARALLPK